MGEKSLKMQEEYKAKYEHNQKIVKILNIFVYILTPLLFIDVFTWFILNVFKNSHDAFTEYVAIPVALMIFGTIAVLMTQINPRMSRTSNVKGDRLILIVGIVIILAGIALLFYNIFA